jgi:hypothetical protein
MSNPTPATKNNIQSHWHQQAIRQAEYLQKLAALMNEYDASFRIEANHKGYDDIEAVLEINAAGSWVPYHDCGCFGVDECIAATQATIDHAKKVAP